MNKTYLDKDGLQQVISAMSEKFNTKLDTLIIQDTSLTPENNTVQLSHISVEQTSTGVKLNAEEVATYNIVTSANPGEYAAVYQFQKTIDGTTTTLGEINIPKDFFLLDVATKTVTQEDKMEGGIFYNNDNFQVDDKYIDFTVGVKNGRKTEEKHIYINFTDIVPDIYTAGVGINIDDNNIINVLYDNDTLYIKDNKLAVKEADGNGNKGILSLPNKTGQRNDYFISIETDGQVSYTEAIPFTEAEINHLFE